MAEPKPTNLNHCQFCHDNVSADLVPVVGYASALACPECAGRLDMSTWPAGRIVDRFRRHWDRAHGQPGALAKILVVEGSPEFQRLIGECAGADSCQPSAISIQLESEAES